MKNMDKKEKREYLRPFRCVGGFILAYLILTNAISVFSGSIFVISSYVSLSEKALQGIISLISYMINVYCFYLGYRIFFKRYDIPLIKKEKLRRNDFLLSLVSVIVIAFITRGIWNLWFDILGVGMEEGSYSNIIDIIYVCLIAPVVEEIIFRGWIVTLLRKYNPYCAILFSAFTFGLIHGNIYQAVPAFIIGLMLGYLVIRFNSLIPSITAHIIINTTSVVSSLMQLNFPEIFYTVSLAMAGVSFVALLIIYRKKLGNAFSGLKQTLILPFYSLSFIFSLVVYLAAILLIK